jgi:hypothetical protein
MKKSVQIERVIRFRGSSALGCEKAEKTMLQQGRSQVHSVNARPSSRLHLKQGARGTESFVLTSNRISASASGKLLLAFVLRFSLYPLCQKR